MVVAEIGVNHDGDPGRARELIEAAAAAGADAVKFQLFRPERLLSSRAELASYQDGQAEDPGALLAGLTLSGEQMRGLAAVARAAGLGFWVTPFSLADVAELEAIGIDGVKIASPDAVNTPLLSAATALERPMLISTGTCDLEELGPAAEYAQRSGGALMQCVSAYPTPEKDAGLGGIAALRARYGGAVGYSDHTAAEDTGALAVAAGACVLEKHLTYRRDAVGPDHAASIEPSGFARYVAAARRAAVMLGPTEKVCSAIERDVRRVSRQSVCPVVALPAGHVLSAEDLAVKRPGTGIPANALTQLAGRRLARGVEGDRPLVWDDLEPV